MNDKDPWLGKRTPDSVSKDDVNQRLTSLPKFIGISFAVILFLLALLLSYSSPLRLFLILAFIVSIALSAIHWRNGKYRNAWLIGALLVVIFHEYDSWKTKRDTEEFCKKYVAEECSRDSEGDIQCPNSTFGCEEIVGKYF